MKPPDWLKLGPPQPNQDGKTVTCSVRIFPWRPTFWPELWRIMRPYGRWRPVLFLPALVYLCWEWR